jgi:hypothetical protein
LNAEYRGGYLVADPKGFANMLGQDKHRSFLVFDRCSAHHSGFYGREYRLNRSAIAYRDRVPNVQALSQHAAGDLRHFPCVGLAGHLLILVDALGRVAVHRVDPAGGWMPPSRYAWEYIRIV